MKPSKLKPFFAIAVCAVIMAVIVALPSLAVKASDAAMFGGGYTAPRNERAYSLSSEGMANETARALYIDHTYAAVQDWDRTMGAGGQHELDALKAAGVVPEWLFLADDIKTAPDNACAITVEPVSGVVTSVWWNGEGVNADELFESYIVYLGLSDTDDYQHTEFQGPNQNETTRGRYYPSAQINVTAAVDGDGKSRSIRASSHSAAEMKRVLEQMQTENEGEKTE